MTLVNGKTETETALVNVPMRLVPLNINSSDAEPTTNGVDDVTKPPRLPRWTRQEILILIQGKKVTESQVRRGRSVAFGSGPVEPKWASISTYCKRHGVNRGPVQCRKRWSNLAGDFKKIKQWEASTNEETESFWVLRNDLKRQRKLPGFFDRDVYDVLNGGDSVGPTLSLALAPVVEDMSDRSQSQGVFDTERSAAATEDGLFLDFVKEENSGGRSWENEVAMVVAEDGQPLKPPPGFANSTPIPEKQNQSSRQASQVHDFVNERQTNSDPEMRTAQEGRKRKDEGEETMRLQNKLIDVLEKNGKMLISQLEAQNVNNVLEQEHQKNHSNDLLAVLNKLADAVGRIADKL